MHKLMHKLMNKLTLAVLTVCLPVISLPLFSIPVCGADEALPSVDTIVGHFIAATGGKAAWEARHSQVEHATIEFAKQGLKGSLIIYEAAPDKYLGVTELPGIGKIAAGSNGEVAWENSALQGPRIKQGDEKADALREGAFNAPLFWQKLYAKGETAGSETAEGHDCYKVVLTPKEGKPVTEFYDKKTGLMIKTTATVSSQMGDVNAEILFDDYRKEGDLLSPHRLVNRAAQQEFVVEIQSVDVNPDLPKDRFDLPPEVRALLNQGAPAGAKPAPAPANHGAVEANPVAAAGQSAADLQPRSAGHPSAGHPSAGDPSAIPGAAEVKPPPAAADRGTAEALSAQSVPGEGGKLAIYMAGNPVANETYTVKRSDRWIEIDGSGSASLGPMKIDIERFQVLTDTGYRPLQAVAKAKMGAIQMNVSASFADGKATNEIDTGQGPQTKSFAVHPDAIVVNSNLPLYPWTLLAMRANFDTHDPQQFPICVLGQAEVNASVVFKGREHVDFAGKSAELNRIAVSGATPDGQPLSIDFWVDDHRKLIKIAVPSQAVEAYQEGFEPLASVHTTPPAAPR
jgi:hypothetical protein